MLRWRCGLIVLLSLLACPFLGWSDDTADTRAGEAADGRGLWNALQVHDRNVVLIAMVPERTERTDIPLSVILANRTGAEILSAEARAFVECTIRITAKNGSQIAYSNLGRYLVGGGSDKSRAIITLRAGETRSWECNLAELFAEIEPGEYGLYLECTLFPRDKWGVAGTEIVLIAKDLPFTIVDP